VTYATLSLSRLFPVVLLLGLLGMTARPATDPDLWWHLRTGQWIAETGTVPRVDPFSFTRAGQPWVSHEWLSEVAFHEIYKYVGFGGLIVFSAVVTTAGFLFLYQRCPAPPYWAAAATVLGAVASAPAWGVRPQMFTFALASLLLWLLERGEKRPWILIVIPPMFLLWLNLHAGFALGPALMMAYAFGIVVEVLLGDAAWRTVRQSVARILGLILVSLALVPLNPSGVQLYRYPLDTLRSAAMRSYIVEWSSPDFHQLRYFAYLLVWLALLAVLARKEYRPKARVLVPLVLTAGLSLDAVRHIPIFVLLAVPVLAKGLSRSRVNIAPTRVRVDRIKPVFAAAALILLAGFTLARWSVLIRGQAEAEAQQFPERAIDVLRQSDFGGQVFAYYDWGGYTIFKLYPKYRVFVDGRADLYGDILLRQFQTVSQVRSGWRQVVDRWKLRVVLIPQDCALTQALMLDPEWQVRYKNARSVLFVRERLHEKADSVTKTSPSG
jgi:hypothetical protein